MTPPPDNLNARILTEQIRTAYNNTSVVLLSSIVFPLMLVLALPDLSTRFEMIVWLVLTLITASARAVLLILYRRSTALIQQNPVWGYFLAIGAGLSGCLWGAAGVMLTEPDIPVQFSLIMLTLAALGAGSVIAYAIYLPVFFAYFLPSLLPFVAFALLGDIQIQLIISVAPLIYLVTLSFFARNLNKVFRESLRLRFENADLVQALTVQKETAEQANASKTQFLAAASHDLRQPLHAMGLLISALDKRVKSPASRHLVTQLSASSDALRNLLNGLLDISRLDAGVVHPRMIHCRVQPLFERMAHDYAATAEEKNLRLSFVLTRKVVYCDATLLERILRNLISNALRYTEQGGVVVGCRSHGKRLCIEVWDSGIGIAAGNMNKIFEEFYQVGNPERDRSQGLGLGLAIARRSAQLLGQQIEVVSIPGRGSRFTLSVACSAEANVVAEPLKLANIGRLPAVRILVIDDESAILNATKLLLSDWGCNDIILADCAAAALAALAQDNLPPQVILADYRLRNNQTGVQAIQQIQAHFATSIPAIIITGDTAPERLREAQASGHHLLHKPLAPAQLRALLRHILVEQKNA